MPNSILNVRFYEGQCAIVAEVPDYSNHKGGQKPEWHYPTCTWMGSTEAMRAVVQRVSRARVTVESRSIGQIERGLVVLLGVGSGDGESDAEYLAEKIVALRIFPDDEGKMNRNVNEIGGAVLAVSQFTLYGDARRGKRPSFDAAARPELARGLFEYFVERVRSLGLRCETGQFQAEMKVELVNDGPVTILLDSQKNF
jgi:D-tyrosyl-tRNA(Tyr) deacylase